MNGRRTFLNASVLSILGSSFTYPACQNCFSRLNRASNSYECSRCGSTSKEATHRYKLCVKVAEGRSLCIITVFGSCLDKIFGIGASELQRHLQDAVQGESNLGRGGAQDLLYQAAEHFFLGRSFLFWVKVPGNEPEDRSTGSAIYYSSRRHLVASQIALPNDDPIGYTVFSCYNQLLQSFLHNSPLRNISFTSSDNTKSDFSVLSNSDSSFGSFPSRNHNFLDCWQQSFGLTASSLCNTSRESVHRKSARDQSKLTESSFSENRFPSNCSLQSIQDFLHKGASQGKNKCTLLTDPSSTSKISTPKIKGTRTSLSNSKINHEHSLLQGTSSFQDCFTPDIHGRQEEHLRKSWSAASRMSQFNSVCALDISSKNIKTAGTHQEEEEMWDDFLFSESLSQFISKIEKAEGTKSQLGFKACKHYLREEPDGSNERLFRTLPHLTGTQVDLLPQSAEKKDLHSGPFSLVSNCYKHFSKVSHCESPTNLPFNKQVDMVFPDLPEIRSPADLLGTSHNELTLIDEFSETCLNLTLKPLQKDKSVYISASENGNQANTPFSHISHSLNDTENTVLANESGIINQWKNCLDIKRSDRNVHGANKQCSVNDLEETNSIRHPLKSRDLGCVEKCDVSDDLFDFSENTGGTKAELTKLASRISTKVISPDINDTSILSGVPYNHSRTRGIHSALQSNVMDDTPLIFKGLIDPSNSDSLTSLLQLDCETADENIVQGADLIPYSQSTPVEKQPSRSVSLGINRHSINTLPNSRSCMVLSVQNKSSNSLKNILLKKMTHYLLKEKSQVICVTDNNLSQYSQIHKSPALGYFPPTKLLLSSPLVNSGMGVLHCRRKKSKFKAARKKSILENKENYSDQVDENMNSNDIYTRTRNSEAMFIQNVPCNSTITNTFGGFVNTRNDTMDLSPICPPFSSKEQDSFDKTYNFPSDWSPELFPEKSHSSQEFDNLQRRLF
ncbi:DNA damage-induced apoptosis suppressor protein [Rhinophrynus dorsalis]